MKQVQGYPMSDSEVKGDGNKCFSKVLSSALVVSLKLSLRSSQVTYTHLLSSPEDQVQKIWMSHVQGLSISAYLPFANCSIPVLFLCSRLLGQLHEMETAFDGFWEKHQLKMEQYLQLWKFEQSFQEVRYWLPLWAMLNLCWVLGLWCQGAKFPCVKFNTCHLTV